MGDYLTWCMPFKQMVPLIKKKHWQSCGNNWWKGNGWSDIRGHRVCLLTNCNNTAMYILSYHRVYSCFTLEAIVATAFGRQINLQRGESDESSKAMDTAMKGFTSGQFKNFILIHSMHKWQSQIYRRITIFKLEILLVCFDILSLSLHGQWYTLILS